MREVVVEGRKKWVPQDASDAALLQMAEGATFKSTTFPSGWVSPNVTLVAKGGELFEVL